MTNKEIHFAASCFKQFTARNVYLIIFLFFLFGCNSTSQSENKKNNLPVAQTTSTASKISHSLFDKVLKKHVNANARVNYAALKKNRKELDQYIEHLGEISLTDLYSLPTNAQIAFYINAYNAITLLAITENYPIKHRFTQTALGFPKNSIRQIKNVWDNDIYKLLGKTVSLNDIEHEILRVKYNEPRIHMALVCAAVSCPPLRSEAYKGEQLEKQLNDQSKIFFSNKRNFSINRQKNTVNFSKIFEWFSGDFQKVSSADLHITSNYGAKEKSILAFAIQYLPKKDADFIAAKDKLKIKYIKYNWSLNSQ